MTLNTFLFVEIEESKMINLRKTKWLLCGTYCPPSQSEGHYLKNNGNDLIFVVKNMTNFCALMMSSWRNQNQIYKTLYLIPMPKNLLKSKSCFKNYRGSLEQLGPCYNTNTWPCFLNSRPSFQFSLKSSKVEPSVLKALQSVSKARQHVLKQMLGRVF